MKLDYGKTFLLGFGFFGISMVWAIYNSYVPVFLARDFGLAAAAVGVVLALLCMAGVHKGEAKVEVNVA